MRQMKSILAATLLTVLAAPAFAAWQDDVNNYDRQRLGRLDESRAKGLSEAARGPKKDLAAIHAVLEPQGRPISARELVGGWQCRQMKLGGLAPTMVYDWFRCRVRETKNGLYFEKITGTERMSGYVESYEGGRMLLMAAITVKKQKQKPYSGGTEGAGAPMTSSDAVGIVSSTGRGRARIEFPFPIIESDFDVIELKR